MPASSLALMQPLLISPHINHNMITCRNRVAECDSRSNKLTVSCVFRKWLRPMDIMSLGAMPRVMALSLRSRTRAGPRPDCSARPFCKDVMAFCYAATARPSWGVDSIIMTHDIVCSRLDCCSRRPSIHHQTTSELHELSAMYAVRLVRSCKPRTLFWMISTDYHASDINSSYCWSRRTVAQVSRT